MSRITKGFASTAGFSRKLVALLSLALTLFFAQSGGHAQSGDALKFFENYFITGDYAAAGVGLRGLGGQNGSPAGIATGTLTVTGVPIDADIVAAFLYWQVVSTTALGPDSGAVNATFDGSLLSSADGPFSKVLDREGTAPCWSSGGGSGGSGGAKRTYTYRADVRRFFPVDETEFLADGVSRNPNFGRLIVNGPHQVTVPDSGSNGNAVPVALGASLVVIYRDPRVPLKAIVLYDGGYTMDQSHESMTQTIKGFYQAATAPTSPARLTHIVGSGQLNKYERLVLPGLAPIANPFTGSSGASWDSQTYSMSVPAGSSQTTTTVDHVGSGTFDCLSWGAIVISTEVQDTDGDGLLDIWESSTAPLLDPNDRPLPNLAAMDADPNHKDLFVEVGYMHADADTAYGDATKPPHSHLPDPEALRMVGDAFASGGINVHFDVGNNDQSGEAGPYVIPGSLARGGEAIPETMTVAGCSSSACEFLDFPGTVGWKVGYKFYRDQLLSATPPAPDTFGNDPCDARAVWPGNDDGPGGLCERRFDRNRNDMFHYVLGAHFIGMPKSEFPCLDGSGIPQGAGSDGLCAVSGNPNFHIPRTSSGVADFPGGDVLLTLGGFSDAAGKPVGTPFMQGSTLLHELGHNFDLSHSGIYRVPRQPQEPNCKPNYLSSMNYLFQLRGLFDDDPLNPGVPHLDYSGEVVGGIDEHSPLDAPLSTPSGTLRYRSGWYAPQGPATIGSAATKHCDGSPLSPIEEAARAAGLGMVRVDGTGVLDPIDWNLDPRTSPAQDVNFDGIVAELLPPVSGSLNAGSNDWSSLRLNQIGSRRNVLGLSLELGRDGLGRGDKLGRDGLGRDGLGRDGLGRDGLGRDGLGRDGLGRDGLGRDGLGRDGLGRDGLGRDGLGRDGLGLDEADEAIAAGSGNPPHSLRASVRGLLDNCAGLSPSACHRFQPTWKATNVQPDHVVRYLVSRFRTDDPTKAKTLAGQVPMGLGRTDYSLVDPEPLPNAIRFTYLAFDEFIDDEGHLKTSGSSVPFSIVAVNNPPTAIHDDAVTDEDRSVDIGVVANDTDPDTENLNLRVVASITDVHGGTAVLQVDGRTVRFTPVANANSVNTPGGFGFTYRANDGYWPRDSAVAMSNDSNQATVSITVNSVNDPPAGSDKTVTTTKGTSYVFASAAFGFTDPYDTPPNALFNVKISTLPLSSVGTLKLNGIAIPAGTSVSKADLDAGKLKFEPKAGKTGMTSFTFQVQDGGGTLLGGIDLDPSPNTMTVNVVP